MGYIYVTSFPACARLKNGTNLRKDPGHPRSWEASEETRITGSRRNFVLLMYLKNGINLRKDLGHPRS